MRLAHENMHVSRLTAIRVDSCRPPIYASLGYPWPAPHFSYLGNRLPWATTQESEAETI